MEWPRGFATAAHERNLVAFREKKNTLHRAASRCREPADFASRPSSMNRFFPFGENFVTSFPFSESLSRDIAIYFSREIE